MNVIEQHVVSIQAPF